MTTKPSTGVRDAQSAAREMAFRRWRGVSRAADAPYAGARAQSPASVLAHHRWGTAAQPQRAPPAAHAGAQPGAFAENAAIFAVLGGVALAAYLGRRGNRTANAAEADPDISGWQSALIAGSIGLTAVLLLLLPGRNWGAVLGIEAVLLAAILPIPANR